MNNLLNFGYFLALLLGISLLLGSQRDTQLELALLRGLVSERAVCEAVTFGPGVDMKIAETWVMVEYEGAEK